MKPTADEGIPARGDPRLLWALFLVPALHPLLLPSVGVASHLLWFVHVLPVALVVWTSGRRHAPAALLASGLLVVAGERLFGAGYGVPADWRTVLSLGTAVTFTNVLVAGFALYARAARDRYRILFHRVRVGVLRVDGEGLVQEANPEAVGILGCPAEILVGRSLTGVLSSPDLGSLDEMAGGGPWTGRVEVTSADPPRSLHVLLAAVAHPDAAEYQVLLADRTTEVLQAREIERQTRLAALGEALAGVAHELKNPLTAILGHAQLGQASSEDGSEAREFFDVVAEQSQRMRALVGELLGFSRPQSDAERTELHALLERVVRVHRMSLPAGVGLELDLRWEGEVEAHPAKVEQIVLNLVSNAAWAVSRDGGGTIRVISGVDGDDALVRVVDDGPGIEPGILDTLFQPFATTKPVGEGTGLGLAISRRLARGWGGDLQAVNGPEGGASFTLRIPRASAVASAGQPFGVSSGPEPAPAA